VSALEGVELNCVSRGETCMYWWGVLISCIVHKEVKLLVKVG
jgi:hypothetical protein